MDCRQCGLPIEREDPVCPHCGASTAFACSTFPYTPRVTGREHRTRAQKTGDTASGFGCGCLMGLLSLMMGIGLAAIPFVGWIFAIGFIGAAFFWPFFGAWIGSMSGED